jgi:hypothetical protein
MKNSGDGGICGLYFKRLGAGYGALQYFVFELKRALQYSHLNIGPLLTEKRAQTSVGQSERLAYLHSLLGVKHFEDSIRYQLLHRTASALLTARDFHAASAVMLVHAFDTPASQRSDFLAFVTAMGVTEVAPLVYCVKSFAQPSLYLAWCNGDPQFRQRQLPSAL